MAENDASVDLDAEFALFEQEIGGLDEDAPAESTDEASLKKDSAPSLEASHKEPTESAKEEKSAGFKRSVQTVYSSAPVASSGQDDTPQVVIYFSIIFQQQS
jgi:hypothetical protein